MGDMCTFGYIGKGGFVYPFPVKEPLCRVKYSLSCFIPFYISELPATCSR